MSGIIAYPHPLTCVWCYGDWHILTPFRNPWYMHMTYPLAQGLQRLRIGRPHSWN